MITDGLDKIDTFTYPLENIILMFTQMNSAYRCTVVKYNDNKII